MITICKIREETLFEKIKMRYSSSIALVGGFILLLGLAGLATL